MNNIGEKINFEEIIKSCRVFDPNETIAQMRGMNPHKFMCWGAKAYIVDNMKNPRMLRFYVSGMKHKGHVYIFLNGMDLYDVYIVTTKGTIVDKSADMGLYFEDLNEWIDDRIEKTDAHAW